jgi:hypothetical protein
MSRARRRKIKGEEGGGHRSRCTVTKIQEHHAAAIKEHRVVATKERHTVAIQELHAVAVRERRDVTMEGGRKEKRARSAAQSSNRALVHRIEAQ